MELNWLDWLILSFLLLASVLGLASGLTRVALRLLVVIFAFFLAWRQGGAVSTWLHDVLPELPEEWMANVAGYLGLFLLALIGGGVAVEIIGKGIGAAGMGGFDRLGGMLFGLLYAYLVALAIFFALSYTPLNESRAIRESRIAVIFEMGSKWIAEHFSTETRQTLPLAEEIDQLPKRFLPSVPNGRPL